VTAPRDRALEDILERFRSRFYGKYRGTVADVDPATCRIKATVPAVLGDVTSGWCLPCVPYAGPQVGFAFLPEVGSGVWIEFEGGDVSYPIWVGCYWRREEVPSGVAAAVKVIATVSPFEFTFDDDHGELTVSDGNGNTITVKPAGISLKRGSQTVTVADSSVSVNDGALEVR
jgi:phage baseplate assembly protein gpV